jgi:hypothetical protein
LLGVHSASIVGLQQVWDWNRPSHKEAFNNHGSPSDILGRPDGRIWSVPKISVGVRKLNDVCIRYASVQKELSVTDEYGTCINVRPAKNNRALQIRCTTTNITYCVSLSPQHGLIDKHRLGAILTSQSIAVTRCWTAEAVRHAIGDIIGDIVGMGKILGDIDVTLNYFYHNATLATIKSIYRL